MYKILLICLGGIVRGNVKNDVGDIPYENQDRQVAAGGILASTGRDYGDVPYEKGVDRNRDYGEIPYEKGFSRAQIEDYGNIQYEKDLGAPNDEFDIKAAATIKMRAASNASDDSAMIDYESPRTIDDSNCDPKYDKCSYCSDKEGYRVYCLNGTTTAAPSDMRLLIRILANLTKDYEDYNNPQLLNEAAFSKSIANKYPKAWAFCPSTTSTTTTPTTTIPPHVNDSRTMAKCFVCGLTHNREKIPRENTICADSFMSHSYKKHCKFINRDGWFYNGTDDFYMWGQWTGGCSMRFVDITPIYTERSCRNRRVPSVGESYASRRLAKLEVSLQNDADACVKTPQASLIPLSRGISLFSRMTVCVCSQNYCNRADRSEAVSFWYTVFAVGVFSTLLTDCSLSSSPQG